MADRPQASYRGAMPPNERLDAIDRTILDLLRTNARRSVKDIATRVNLSSAAAGRRIERLERCGVIAGYTAVVRDSVNGASLDAFTELRFAGDTDVKDILAAATRLPEVLEAYTTAGDPDAIVRLRVDNVGHLQRVVNQLRSGGRVTGTKTLIILERWTRHPGS